MSTENAIEVHDVVKIFDTRTVLDRINLNVQQGETLVILGGSGSGKSTLLRIMTGGIRVNGGTVRAMGKNLCAMTTDEIDDYRKTVGVLFQSGALFNSMTVGENVALPLREHTDLPDETIDIIVKIKLELVGLREHTDKMPAELSGGMKKRAGLARALALDPELLFLDEPTAGLDPISANQFDELIKNLQKSLGLTVVMVTHDIDTLRAITDRIAVLVNKKLKIGTMDELRKDKDPWIQEYFSGVRGRAALAQ